MWVLGQNMNKLKREVDSDMVAEEFTELRWWQGITAAWPGHCAKAGAGKISAKVNTAEDYRAEEELISRQWKEEKSDGNSRGPGNNLNTQKKVKESEGRLFVGPV